jgi:phosphoglycerol transferase MdoB-like AlkP superfamily enzyme
LVSHNWKNQSSNQYVNELSGSGIYDFGFAFWHNELDYNTFYKTIAMDRALSILSKNLGFAAHGKSDHNTIRNITSDLPEKIMNVVLISVESLSAEFLGSYGNTQRITPNLDSLAKGGMRFTKLYASGTRTAAV